MLALLATARDCCRTREWLRDKLWSESPTKQGSDSLRQSLMDIRRALGGDLGRLVLADREKIWLDPELLYLDVSGVGSEGEELFSDLAITDPEFEDWIRTRRAAAVGLEPTKSQKPEAPRFAPAVFFRMGRTSDLDAEGIVSSIASYAITALLEFSDFHIFDWLHQPAGFGAAPPKLGVAVNVSCIKSFDQWYLRSTFQHPVTGRILRQREHWLMSVADHARDQFYRVSAALVETVLEVIAEERDQLAIENCASLLAAQGRSLIFRFDRGSLVDADRLLRLAYDYEPRPQYLAWRSFLRNMAKFQHQTDAFFPEAIDIHDLLVDAFHQAPQSSFTLTTFAHIEYLSGGSKLTSRNLAERALAANPANALGHAVLSNTELAMGDLRAARQRSLIALDLAGNGDTQAFVEFFCCMTAAALGKYGEAIAHAENAYALRPSFTAPKRYLVALYKAVGREAEHGQAVERMQLVESGFTAARLLDPLYPVTTMQRMRLIDVVARS